MDLGKATAFCDPNRLIWHEGCVIVLWNNLLSKHPVAIRNINRGEQNHQPHVRFDKIIWYRLYQVFSAYAAIIRCPYVINNVKKIVYSKSGSINENVSALMSNRGFRGSASLFSSAVSSHCADRSSHNLEQGEILFNITNEIWKKIQVYLKWSVKKPKNMQFMKGILLLNFFYITFQ